MARVMGLAVEDLVVRYQESDEPLLSIEQMRALQLDPLR